MKKVLFGTMLLALVIVIPLQTMAQVGISVNIGLPPPIAFAAPPDVIVMPDTDDVYVVPDIDIDLFFWSGWWWRLWEGHWYRSHYYDRGWDYYNYVPTFYYDVDPGWRGYYRDRNWYGHRWDYERIPHRRLQQNWSSWHNDRYWERQTNVGCPELSTSTTATETGTKTSREWQYQQRPEARQFQQTLKPDNFNRESQDNTTGEDSTTTRQSQGDSLNFLRYSTLGNENLKDRSENVKGRKSINTD